MGGFSNVIWFWVPVLIYKAISAFLRTLWRFNLWILQTVSGVPLYYSKPQYRIPAIFVGTLGVMSLFNFTVFLLILGSSSSGGNIPPGEIPPITEVLLMGIIGVGLLLLCRFLIRRGSI